MSVLMTRHIAFFAITTPAFPASNLGFLFVHLSIQYIMINASHFYPTHWNVHRSSATSTGLLPARDSTETSSSLLHWIFRELFVSQNLLLFICSSHCPVCRYFYNIHLEHCPPASVTAVPVIPANLLYILKVLVTEAAHENAQRHRQLSCHGRRASINTKLNEVHW
jgi:hypothetical protein